MPKTKFSKKERSEILNKVLKKSHQYHEESLKKQEEEETESFLDDAFKDIS